jgi:hypothetical protein
MNEGSGTVLHDSSGDLNGSFTGTPTWGTDCLIFDYTFTSSIPINVSYSEFSVSIWYKVIGVTTKRNSLLFTASGSSIATSFGLTFGDPTVYEQLNKLILTLNDQAFFVDAVDGDAWHNLLITYSHGNFVIYLDGIPCESGSGTVTDAPVVFTDLMLGYYMYYPFGPALDGSLRKLALFSKALTSQEALAVYQAG